MAKTPEAIKVAVDTSLLLNLFLEEEPSYSERTERVFSDSNYQVYLPTLVGVEAVAAPRMRNNQQKPPISNRYIDAAKEFLETVDVIWVELDEFAMQRAQKLGPERMIRAQDVAILSCAIEAECQYLFTKDKKLIKATAGLEDIEVCLPPELGSTQTALTLS
ncbi:type II toxin-antitoxin system VapC family toxin [Corynebacterium sp. 11A]|uniref:type II toxin-antitoxin system VapC family toxin n=1 Tax=Corynebacterium sp. 11A TaxID=2080510 RepID=UPI00124F1B53|nr:type II toxin-antitoxin system VapC family toxin [Corynebacterium sp. 11A]